jgi:hypothetical protein
VTTFVAAGAGSGGSIQIKSPLMVLGNSEITANAIGGSGDTVGHFPTLTSCGIWDQGSEF